MIRNSLKAISLYIFLIILLAGCPLVGHEKKTKQDRKNQYHLLFIDFTVPEKKTNETLDKARETSDYLLYLLKNNSRIKVTRIRKIDINNSADKKCSSLLSVCYLQQLMKEYHADTILYGDLFSSGKSEYILILNRLHVNSEHFEQLLIINPAGKTRFYNKDNYSLIDLYSPESRQPNRNKKDITVCIDPGHGGVDTGADCINGSNEKNYNNRLARFIADELVTRGYNVEFTREPENDIFLNTKARIEKINTLNTDLLISVHHNYSEDYSDSGFSIYYTSLKPKLDNEDTYILIEGEKFTYLNQKTLNGHTTIYYLDSEGDIHSTDTLPGSIFFDPFIKDDSPNIIAVESQKMAILLYLGISKLKILPPFSYQPEWVIEDRDYAVLREINVPAVLIEAGFLTNSKDIKIINDEENHRRIAEAVADAVDIYFTNTLDLTEKIQP